MRPSLILTLLAGALALAPSVASADGYFTKGEKKLAIEQEGDRTRGQNTTLLSLVGATVLSGAVGTYYLLDSRTLSDKISASGTHTLRTWDQELEDTRKDALRSSKIATVSIGISGGFALATLVTYIVTQPDTKTGYAEWQAKHIPVLAPTDGGLMMSRGWSF